MTPGPQLPDDNDELPWGATPDIPTTKMTINWRALAAIAVIVGGLALVSVVLAIVAALLILLLVTVNVTGMGNWIRGR